MGFTCRCIHSALLGTPSLPGGQAQYIRIPKAGGTLFSLSALRSPSNNRVDLTKVADSSLLLLADILPTGVFAALQALQHPKISPMLTKTAYPYNGFIPEESINDISPRSTEIHDEDGILTLAAVGLGPVGIVSQMIYLMRNRDHECPQCAVISLLDMLAGLEIKAGLKYQVIAIDPLESRREKMQAAFAAIDVTGKGTGKFTVASIEDGKKVVHGATSGAGCNAVLEVTLACEHPQQPPNISHRP